MKIYLVWERESFDEYDVIFVTLDEQKAKEISGEDFPCTWYDKKNDNNYRWYIEKQIDKEYALFE